MVLLVLALLVVSAAVGAGAALIYVGLMEAENDD